MAECWNATDRQHERQNGPLDPSAEGPANAQHVKTKLINFGSIGREQVRLEARNYALSMIYKFLTEVQ